MWLSIVAKEFLARVVQQINSKEFVVLAIMTSWWLTTYPFSLQANIIIARFVAELVFRLSVFIHVKLLCKSSYLAGIYSPTMLSLSSNVCHCIEKGHRISQCHLEVEIAAHGFNFKILLVIFWLNDYHQSQLMTYIDLFYVTHK